jgi:hypothetical protein
MSYHDLPDDIRSHPLSEGPIRGDVIDLILGIEDRSTGALGIMVCDELDCGIQPLVLAELPDDEGADPLVDVLDMLLPTVAHEHGSVLIGRGRPDSSVPTDDDRAWHQAALDACARHRVRLLGFFIATPGGLEELPSPLGAVPS